jgi:N-acyl-D-aspartate/D-glutamate deacylase
MMTQPTVSGYAEFVKYILNQRIGATGAAIAGYTALRTQILNKAGSTTDPDRFAAQWILEQYQARQEALEKLRDENRRINKERQPTTLIRN